MTPEIQAIADEDAALKFVSGETYQRKLEADRDGIQSRLTDRPACDWQGFTS